MRGTKTLGFTATAIATIAVAAGIYWQLTRGPTAFERSTWLQGEVATDHPRLRMADGLLRTDALLGKSKVETETMLGPPTSTDKFKDSGLVYWLGPERGFLSIDSEWLALSFDEAGKVRDARIVRD